jgi:hypothetical protein
MEYIDFRLTPPITKHLFGNPELDSVVIMILAAALAARK